MGKRYCVFAAYNNEQKITKELIFYLEELNKISDGVVFVMDNPLDDEEKKKLENLAIYSECRKHGEYDFGSYKRGFFYLKENGYLDKASEVIFANDSCYGPQKPLKNFIEKWKKENKPNFYGITINNCALKYSTEPYLSKFSPHVQSYFFLVTKNIFEKEFFVDFFKSVKHLDSYGQIIKTYEMGLSDLILENGYQIKAYFDFKDYKKDPVYKGLAMFKTVRNGFFVKKKNFTILGKSRGLANYILSRSLFPYVFDKKRNFTKKHKFNLSVFYLLEHIFYMFTQNIFSIENKGCAKVIKIFGINFKIKKYDYSISKANNSIIIKDGNRKTTPKQKKIKGLEIKINGSDNLILLSPNYKFENSSIEINANNCTIDIRSKYPISNLNIKLEKENYQSLTILEKAKISSLNISSPNVKDVLISVENGEITTSSAKFETYKDKENRPRIRVTKVN